MKRYAFRAEKVLRVRRLQEDIARSGVAAARRDEAVAAAALAASQDRYSQLVGQVPAPQSATAFLAWQERAGQRAGAVIGAQSQQRVAREATATALDGWRDAHRNVEGLERLDDRRREEYEVEVRRDEDLQADETVIARARRVL